MKNNVIDAFFFYAARVIILIPIVIIVLALFFKFKQNKSQLSSVPVSTPTVIPSISAPKIQIASVSAAIDLTGPWVCNFEENNATISAYIQDKSVYVNNAKSNYFLLTNDCFYIWQNNVYTGQKICGVGKYETMFQQMSSLGLISINNLPSLLGQFGQFSSIASNSAALKNILSSCKKEAIEDQNVFKIPKNIIFKNTSL